MIAHFFNKGIFLRPTGSGSLWKQVVGDTRWRSKHGVSMSFAKVEIYIDAIALLDHDFCPQHSFQGDIWMLRSTLSWHHCLPHAQVVISRDVRKKTRLFFALSLISTTSACSLSRRRTLYYFSNLIGPCVLIARSPKRISDHFTLFTFECMLFQHGCSRFQFPAWLWGKGVHVIISVQKRILSPQEIEYCLIL